MINNFICLYLKHTSLHKHCSAANALLKQSLCFQRPNGHRQVQSAGVRRRDWHDYAVIKSEAARSGTSHDGKH